MIRRPPRSTQSRSSAASDVYKRQKRDIEKPFLMPLEDIFSIEGRGTVVTGRIERGVVNINQEVELVGIKDTRKVVVTGIEMFNKQLNRGEACLLYTSPSPR